MFPVDIISIIYQYTCISLKEVDVLKSYSREWHIAGTLKTSYNNTILFYSKRDQNLEKLVKNYPHIKHVIIFDITNHTIYSILNQLAKFKSLTILELNTCHINYDIDYFSSYTSLTSLILINSFIDDINLNALQKCKSLTSLTISGYYICYTNVMSFIKQCSLLSSLTIIDCTCMTDYELYNIGDISSLSNVCFNGGCYISNEIIEYLTSKKIKIVINK